MTGLLALDLDGTTLRFDHSLAEEDIAAAARARAAGVHVTIITGRLYTGSSWVAEALGIDDVIGLMNGSDLVRVRDHQTVYRASIDGDAQEQVRSALHAHGLTSFLFGAHEIHALRQDAHYERYLTTWTRRVRLHPERVPWGEPDVVGICAVGEVGPIESAAGRIALHPELAPEVFTTFSGEAFLKVRRRGDDKGTALRRIAEHHGVPMEQTVAVGDWINDLPMFGVAGRSFAMNQADGDAIAAADEVLEAVRGTGGAVAEVIERVWDL